MIEGNVLKGDDTRYADADLIALANNGLLHLFSSLKLTLAGQTVEHVNYPGQATSWFGELFINILQKMWTGARLVSIYQHQRSC